MNQKRLRNTDLTSENIGDEIKSWSEENHRVKNIQNVSQIKINEARWLFLSQFWPLLKHASLIEAAGAVVKISSSLWITIWTKLSLSKSAIRTVCKMCWWTWLQSSSPRPSTPSFQTRMISLATVATHINVITSAIIYKLQLEMRMTYKLQVTSLLKQDLEITKLHWTPTIEK